MKKILLWLIALSWAYLIFYLTTIPDFKPTTNSLMSMFLSSGGHLFFFGFLAILIPVSPAWSLITTTTYGLIIELIQRSIPGRSFSLLDLGLDIFGAITFLAIIKKYENSRDGWSRIHRSDHG